VKRDWRVSEYIRQARKSLRIRLCGGEYCTKRRNARSHRSGGRVRRIFLSRSTMLRCSLCPSSGELPTVPTFTKSAPMNSISHEDLTIIAGAAFSPTHSSSFFPSGAAASSERSKLSTAIRPCEAGLSFVKSGVAKV